MAFHLAKRHNPDNPLLACFKSVTQPLTPGNLSLRPARSISKRRSRLGPAIANEEGQISGARDGRMLLSGSYVSGPCPRAG